MKIIKKILFNVIIPVLILAVGVFLFKKMKAGKEAPKKIKIENKIPVVKIKSFKKINENIIIKENGTISFPDQVSIVPRVSGNIIKLTDKLFIGGFIQKGDLIAIIEQSDYILNVEAAEAEVSNRETALEQQEEEAKLAQIEWDIYKKNHPKAKPSNLRLKIPQVNTAKANLNAAKANLKKAKLNLSRTYIKSPFDAKVQSKNVSLGQYVAPGTNIAVLQSTARAYVKIYLKNQDISMIDNLFDKETDVEVSAVLGDKKLVKAGKIISWGASLDSRTKMLEVIVEIKNPYEDQSFPLISGSYVSVSIKGKEIKDVFRVSENIVIDNNIYIYDNGALKIKPVDMIKQIGNELVIKGITQDDKVIITPIVDVVNNMKVELEE
jgi:RND family efflux transporter MFP subunit